MAIIIVESGLHIAHSELKRPLVRIGEVRWARAPVRACGVIAILFELVSGRKPFVGENVADLALRIALRPVPRLPEGPAVLDEIIARRVASPPPGPIAPVGESLLPTIPMPRLDPQDPAMARRQR